MGLGFMGSTGDFRVFRKRSKAAGLPLGFVEFREAVEIRNSGAACCPVVTTRIGCRV